jgi:seryl-tRNA synthetase
VTAADGARSLYDGLVAHGLLVPVGVAGVFGRGAAFEDVLERFNALVTRSAAEDRAESVMFPPVIDRRVLDRVRYLESFPQLCGSVHSFFGDAKQATELAEQSAGGGDWGPYLGQTGVVLAPACCYPLYPTLAGTLPPGGRVVSLLGWAYRHEPSAEPTRMQAFRVRELIRAGAPDEVLEWRDRWLERGVELLESLGLPTQTDVAADPFFGRRGKMMGASQKEQKLKFEVMVPVISAAEPTALCSFNYHQDKFGSEFGIHTADGAVAHTACLGFGMERVAMALFKLHGFVPDAWPTAVRRLLWP